MTKKISKIIAIVFMALFIISMSRGVYAKQETTIGQLTDDIESINPDAMSAYVIGKYVFTSANALQTQDVMLAARSIETSPNAGEKKGEKIYDEMTIYYLEKEVDEGGKSKGWIVGSNLTGTTKWKLDASTPMDIRYIDYKEIFDTVNVDDLIKNAINEIGNNFTSSVNNKDITITVKEAVKNNAIDKTIFEKIAQIISKDTNISKIELTVSGAGINTDVLTITNDSTSVDTWFESLKTKLSINKLSDLAGKTLKVKVTVKNNAVVEGTNNAKDVTYNVTFKVEPTKVNVDNLVSTYKDSLNSDKYEVNFTEKDNTMSIKVKGEQRDEIAIGSTGLIEGLTKIFEGNEKVEKVILTFCGKTLSIEKTAASNAENVKSSILSWLILNKEETLNETYLTELAQSKTGGQINKQLIESLTNDELFKALKDANAKIEIVLASDAASENNKESESYDITFSLGEYPKYTVTFDDADENGATSVPSQEVTKHEKVTKPTPDPERAGYRFDGWYKNEEQEQYNFENEVTEEFTLKAKWVEIKEVDIETALNTAIRNISTTFFEPKAEGDTVTVVIKEPSELLLSIKGSNILDELVKAAKIEGIKSISLNVEGASSPCEVTSETSTGVVDTWFKTNATTILGKDPTTAKRSDLAGKTFEVTISLKQDYILKDGSFGTYNFVFKDEANFGELVESVTGTEGLGGSHYSFVYKDGTITATIKDVSETLDTVKNTKVIDILLSQLATIKDIKKITISDGKEQATTCEISADTLAQIAPNPRQWLVDYIIKVLNDPNKDEEADITNKDLLNLTFTVTVELNEDNATLVEGSKTEFKVEFKAETCTVKFKNYNNEDGVDSDKEVIVNRGDVVAEPDAPTYKDGYIFKEWQTEKGEAYTFESKVTDDITLTAKWLKRVDVDKYAKDIANVTGREDFNMSIDSATTTNIKFNILKLDEDIINIKGSNTGICDKLSEMLSKDNGVEKIEISYTKKENGQGPCTLMNGESATVIAGKLITALQDITGKEVNIGGATLNDLTNKTLNIKVTLKKGEGVLAEEVEDKNKLEAGDEEKITKDYTLKFLSEAKLVKNEQELVDALSSDYKKILIGASFEVDKEILIGEPFKVNEDNEIPRNVTIENNGNFTITRINGGDSASYVFKVTNGANATLKRLKITGASSGVYVEKGTLTVDNLDVSGCTESGIKVGPNGKFTGINTTLKYSNEDYNHPAILVESTSAGTGTVSDENTFARVDNVKTIIKGEGNGSDTLQDKEGVKHYYLVGENTQIFSVMFEFNRKIVQRYLVYGEKIVPPTINEVYDDNLFNHSRYKFTDKWETGSWGSSEYEEVELKGETVATKNVKYYPKYTVEAHKEVSNIGDLQNALNNNTDGQPIVIKQNIDIGELKITGSQEVTLIGDGDVTLTGTINVDSTVPRFSLYKLHIKGKETGNQVGDRYYIVKSDSAKNVMWYTTFTNGADSKEAYSAIYLSGNNDSNKIFADIRWSTFNTAQIYNTIEFGYGKEVVDDTVVSSNEFKGTPLHNHINIYTVEPNAKIEIESNVFDVSKNAIRLSNTTGADATFWISYNRYTATDSISDYAGFVVMQNAEGADDFSKYTIISNRNRGIGEGVVFLTKDKSNKQNRFEYYASADGKTVDDDNPNGSGKNATVIFVNDKILVGNENIEDLKQQYENEMSKPMVEEVAFIEGLEKKGDTYNGVLSQSEDGKFYLPVTLTSNDFKNGVSKVKVTNPNDVENTYVYGSSSSDGVAQVIDANTMKFQLEAIKSSKITGEKGKVYKLELDANGDNSSETQYILDYSKVETLAEVINNAAKKTQEANNLTFVRDNHIKDKDDKFTYQYDKTKNVTYYESPDQSKKQYTFKVNSVIPSHNGPMIIVVDNKPADFKETEKSRPVLNDWVFANFEHQVSMGSHEISLLQDVISETESIEAIDRVEAVNANTYKVTLNSNRLKNWLNDTYMGGTEEQTPIEGNDPITLEVVLDAKNEYLVSIKTTEEFTMTQTSGKTYENNRINITFSNIGSTDVKEPAKFFAKDGVDVTEAEFVDYYEKCKTWHKQETNADIWEG